MGFFSFNSTAFNLGGCYFLCQYSFQIGRLSQQQHLPTAQKNTESPKAHMIILKLSLIMACNPWDPARLCGFAGGLPLQLQVSQIANALNQFGGQEEIPVSFLGSFSSRLTSPNLICNEHLDHFQEPDVFESVKTHVLSFTF